MLRARSLILPLQVLLLCSNVVYGQRTLSSADILVLERGTPIQLQLAQTISSGRLYKGDIVDFVVQRAVVRRGFTVVRAGSRVEGVVVGVKRSRFLGMGGNITIQISSIEAASGDKLGVSAPDFKGRSQTLRRTAAAAVVASIYLPATPVLLFVARPREHRIERHGGYHLYDERAFDPPTETPDRKQRQF